MLVDAATLNAWAAVWSANMIAIAWQSALLAGAAGLVAALLWRASPAVRYWLWQIVAAKLLLMPLWSVSFALAWLPATAVVNRPAENTQAVAETRPPDEHLASPLSAFPWPLASGLSAPSDATPPEALPPRLSWTAWLMLVWAVVVIGQLGLLLWHLARLRHLLKHASPAGNALESLVRDGAARLKLARAPRVLTVERECSPFVCGVWRPVIVLPKSLERLLSADALAPVIMHELAHVRRWDLLWNWISQIARILHFFNPIVYLVAFRVRLEAELACDSWAMATTGKEAGDYADLLLRVIGLLSEAAMLRLGSAASARFDGHCNLNRNQ
jgi:beta-lactamase regulating signal transducer with metallopeptidase domain